MSYYGSRSRLAKIVLEKIENDKRLNELDKTQWYQIPGLQDLKQSSKFIELNEDEETKEFIANCYQKSEWFVTQLFHSVMLTMLKWFMNVTTINGLLHRGSMFVFSVHHFRMLIDFDTVYGGVKLNNLLDLGAGDGAVTTKMAPFFNNVYATEMSTTMQWRLSQKGFKILDVYTWDTLIESNLTSQQPEQQQQTNPNDPLVRPNSDSNNESSIIQLENNSTSYVKFDAIACLNLLDRCDTPLTLLKKMKNALKPNGLLIVALVLPFKPFVEYNKDNKPTEYLLDKNINLKNKENCNPNTNNQSSSPNPSQDEHCSTEPKVNLYQPENGKKLSKVNYQIDFLLENVFEPIGFDLVKFSKLPYLCEGNLQQSYYYMIDYIFIFRSKN